jgi:uncharacterized membrane protein YbhN (UPF0104 family)
VTDATTTPAAPAAAPRRPRVPPALATTLRVAVVLALFAWIASRLDWDELKDALRHADRADLGLAFLALVASQLAAAWRWHRLLRAAGSRWTFARSVSTYGAGLFLGLFLPTGVGGDVYRVAQVRGSGAGLARGAATVLLERAVGLAALFLLGAGFVAAHPATRAWTPLFAAGALLGILGMALLWTPGGIDRVASMLTRFGKPGLAARLLAAFPDEAMARLRSSMPGTFLLSLANHAFLLFVNVLLARGLGIAVPWPAIAAAVPLVLLAAQIPITPGGTGLREAAYLYFLGRVGVSHALALALALGWLAVLAGVSLVGAVGFLFERAHGREAAARQTNGPADRSTGPSPPL